MPNHKILEPNHKILEHIHPLIPFYPTVTLLALT